MVTERDLENAKKIYQFMQLNERLKKCDCILGLGCSDTNVAKRTADLYLLGYGDIVIFSGGVGKITRNWEITSEAEYFKKIAVRMGVPEDVIYTETESSNIGENFNFTDDLIHNLDLNVKSIMVVTKTGVQKRVKAAFEKQMPNYEGIITALNESFERNLLNHYMHDIPLEEVICLLVSDLQKLHTYFEKGYQTYVEVPVEIIEIYNELINNCYGKYTQ